MTHRKLFLLGGVVALLGILLAGIGIFSGSFSPRGYVAKQFTRAAAHDIGRDAKAYTSGKAPSVVSKQITSAWKPADQYVDASGVYLRYKEDAVVILPRGSGSLILVEPVRTAARRYYGTVNNHWGWGRDTTVRGGGPGSGK
jgi:hypothetical protein